MYSFDVKKATDECVGWIIGFFKENGDGCNAVLGISGGKDSSVTAALLVRALGVDRVFGVLMPNGIQSDIEDSREVCRILGIKSITVDISGGVDGVSRAVESSLTLSRQAVVNLPPRIRMATLYAVSQSVNGRVANTCNLSEDWVGYSTRYGDAAGDFAPLAGFTVTEIKQIGQHLGLPGHITHKTPSDGLCGKTDEDNLGFTYAELDRYIREGIQPPKAVKDKIDRLHTQNKFKMHMMPMFKSSGFETAIKN